MLGARLRAYRPDTAKCRLYSHHANRCWLSPACSANTHPICDGLRTALLMLNGALQDYCFAAQLANGEIVSTQFFLPPTPNVTYSACLVAQIEEMMGYLWQHRRAVTRAPEGFFLWQGFGTVKVGSSREKANSYQSDV